MYSWFLKIPFKKIKEVMYMGDGPNTKIFMDFINIAEVKEKKIKGGKKLEKRNV